MSNSYSDNELCSSYNKLLLNSGINRIYKLLVRFELFNVTLDITTDRPYPKAYWVNLWSH